MSGWKTKIEAARRRSSFEILNRLWYDNSQVIGLNRPQPSSSTYNNNVDGTVTPLRCSEVDEQEKLSTKRSEEERGAVVLATPAKRRERRMNTDIMETGAATGRNGVSENLSCIKSDCAALRKPRCRIEAITSDKKNGEPELDSLLSSASSAKFNRNRNRPIVIAPMSRTDGSGKGKTGNASVHSGNNNRDEDRGNSKLWKSHGNHSMGLVLSALYAKLLVVMGIAFPLSEVMSTYIPGAYYDGFYLYLYFGSILFMIWVFGYMLRERATVSARVLVRGMNSFRSKRAEAIGPLPLETTSLSTVMISTPTTPVKPNLLLIPCDKSSTSEVEEIDSCASSSTTESPQTSADAEADVELGEMSGGTSTSHHHHRRQKGTHFGSFYLRIGCVAFGIGSMIYSGLEFGQYFELNKSDSKCQNYMMALTPSLRMIFTFMQMYFIFLSSRMAVFNETLSSQFGLMHMIGTNLCVWLNVLVQETKHEILTFYDPDNKTISFKFIRAHQQFSGSSSISAAENHGNQEDEVFYVGNDSSNLSMANAFPDIYDDYGTSSPTPLNLHHRVTRGLIGPYSIHQCGRTNIIGSIVQDAAPFLFPCTIEYSLICAAICYVMWKSMAKRKTEKIAHKHLDRRSYVPLRLASKSPHHYTVDCAASHKGLFLGIFVLVLTIMSLIIHFVLVKHPDYRVMANLEAHITEIVLYTMATCSVVIGMCQLRALRYSHGRNLELDNILLIVAQTGSLIFNIFAIISGQFVLEKGENLVLVTALLKVIQLLLQTLFILDASKRVATTMDQAKKKPGREVVTFLLITNLAMWLINALEKSRGESHPAQLQFYGVWAWTIITHISMPLAIFYRFHSTVCLCEIWKRAYKLKHVVA